MAPHGATVTSLLKQTVYYHLDNFTYGNALFFAERLHAHAPQSQDSVYILALCHLRLGDYHSVYEVCKNAGCRGTHLGCAFIFAQACLELGKHKDGITALEKSRGLWSNKNYMGKHSAGTRAPNPDSATINCLLGKLYRGYDDKNKAVTCFEEALKTNPFMWDAFTTLCDMGLNVRVPSIFKTNDTLVRQFDEELIAPLRDQRVEAAAATYRKTALQSVAQDVNDPFLGPRSASYPEPSSNGTVLTESAENDLMSKINAARTRLVGNMGGANGTDGMETPTTNQYQPADIQPIRTVHTSEPPRAPPRRPRGGGQDQALVDANPPRMSYRLGSRRREKPEEVPTDVPADKDNGVGLFRGSGLSIAATERKRTVSGHPAHPRPNGTEETGIRRSARLNMFPKSTTAASKANSGAVTVGPTATRELKKARPPISRIMRPGSSGTNPSVGRVVSGGQRKPLEENNSGMDVDYVEAAPAPRQREVQTQSHPPAAPLQPVESDMAKIEEALRWFLELLKKLGQGYLLASQFQCQDALSSYSSIPKSHRDTPWVMAQMGKAHYEQANYVEAEKLFKHVRMVAPKRLEDMEVYSTVLWHLKMEKDLAFLSHELTDFGRESPQAWCAVGNSFSLTRETEHALACFKRATQVDPTFAYAYTLQGHEHVANEEYDKALSAYRLAVTADKRHYNAYYGLGKVYEKLGNYQKAFGHYHVASAIHPTNAVLICCMGTIYEKQKDFHKALHYFSKATDLAPKAALTRFKKARALLAIGDLAAAQRELMILKDLAPDFAEVHFILGKLFKRLHNRKEAVKHFTVALSLDPKASHEIKKAIESLDDEHDQLDDSMMH